MRTAVILFNLGGPDKPEAVEPFLFNLFNDPAIIGLPTPFRWLLAKLISKRRAPIAKEIYANLGGGSPLLPLTQEQADSLENALGEGWKAFIAMRYWHPFADQTAHDVKKYAPDRIVLLPLYPQFSTTTSASSIANWRRAAKRAGIEVPVYTVCCYPTLMGWIAAQADVIAKSMDGFNSDAPVRVLFSAHGLPKKIVAGGDPYQWQVEQTAHAVAVKAELQPGTWKVCYQSRVGPLEWIGPSIDEALQEAARDKVAVVVVPIAFVSEHSETLVELDIEYREKADELDIPGYVRVPAVGTHPEFIAGLAQLVKSVANHQPGVQSWLGTRFCSENLKKCPCAA